jgi:uroporphyrinogen III methyltransferase / synthase
MKQPATVYLVGAGPGHGGLITLRAVECLRRAAMVIYDTLVSERILDHCPPDARRVCVTELGPCHAERGLPIQQRMIEAARAGQCVVRLKGGDPFLFGRGGEEALALREAGIPFEIVPGVTAALGVSAFAGIPLTHRDRASCVTLVTGHENASKDGPGIDWGAMALVPGTLVVYMGLARLDAIAQTLLAHGKPADTPTAVVQAATTGRQKTIVARLAEIASAASFAELASPALVVIGAVAALCDELSWFERLPLFGRTVLVCRPHGQAEETARRLEEFGAVALVQPTLAIGPPNDWGPLDAALANLAAYDWLVFTSVHGVRGFFGRLLERGQDMRALAHLELAVIGPGTAEALHAFHLRADLLPDEFRSESLAAALAPLAAGKSVLLARADRGRPFLRNHLAQVARTHEVAVYSQSDVVKAAPQIVEQLQSGRIDFVLATSSNVVRALASMLDQTAQEPLKSGKTAVVSISPVTSAAIRDLGWPVAAEAKSFTMDGVLEAVGQLAAKKP